MYTVSGRKVSLTGAFWSTLEYYHRVRDPAELGRLLLQTPYGELELLLGLHREEK